MTLGERIKGYRVKEGLSQEQLAETLNVSRQAITKWENDKGIPDIDNLISISRIVGATLDELVIGESGVKEEASKQRKRDCVLHLLAAIVFTFSSIIWFVSGCVNLDFNTPLVPVLNFFSAAVCMIMAVFQAKKYTTYMEQER